MHDRHVQEHIGTVEGTMNVGHRTRRKAIALVSRPSLTRPLLVFAGIVAVIGGAAAKAAQQPPPIHGVTGTIRVLGDESFVDVPMHWARRAPP